jgi:15-cis-phytoene synthase
LRPEDEHCAGLVRAADTDRWLAALFAPEDKRPHLLALAAFYIEIARIREIVSDPKIGEIRQQWWRDALDALYAGEVPDHPVAKALSAAIVAGDLPKHALGNMIDARGFDLYDDPMPDLNTLEGYLGETSSMLIQMGARVLAGDDALGAAEAAGLAGVAYGLTGLMRALPLYRARGQCYLPREMLVARDLMPADLMAGKQEEAIGLVLSELRHHARKRLAEAREKIWLVPKATLPAFLPVSLTDLYLKRLDRMGAKAIAIVADVPQWRRQWRLFWQARFEVF